MNFTVKKQFSFLASGHRTKLDIMFMLLLQINVILSAHVSGTITENTTFYYRKLPVVPSIRATIEFSVSYSQRSMAYEYPSIGIYTNYPKLNTDKRCSYQEFGQLRNENLYAHFRLGRRYRTTTCELSGPDTVNCRGRITVQDYIPRNFYLTFGLHCDLPPMYSLNGLQYNISFSQQSNSTNGCTNYSMLRRTGFCSRFYNETSLPNLIGDEHVEQSVGYLKQSVTFEALLFQDGTCYQHLSEFACYIILPKCDPVTQQVTHPCREMCWDSVHGCWSKWLHVLNRRGSELNISKALNCDYLPSLHGNVPCFYKPVTCDSPPDIPNSTVMIDGIQKDVYYLHDVVQYACVNEAFDMRGNRSITCLHSGQWSHPPPRCIDHFINSLHPLLVVLPILIMCFTVYVGLAFCTCCSQVKHENLRRNRDYDAFVCYCYEGQDPDFAEKIIPQELEEKHGLKLCIHRRDFKAGWDIKWNIMNAIRNSNSAIIIMSQDYINSLWCREEFEDCYMENMKDPAFKLFVILMQPADTLNITNEYIKSFFAKKTYLERDDDNLFLKIAEYLTWVKQPKGGKPPLDGTTEDTIDPLLGNNNNKNEDDMVDNFMMEEDQENIIPRKLDNAIEVDICSEDSDEGSIASSSQSDGESADEFLDVGDMEKIFENPREDEQMDTLFEVHLADPGVNVHSTLWQTKSKLMYGPKKICEDVK